MLHCYKLDTNLKGKHFVVSCYEMKRQKLLKGKLILRYYLNPSFQVVSVLSLYEYKTTTVTLILQKAVGKRNFIYPAMPTNETRNHTFNIDCT